MRRLRRVVLLATVAVIVPVSAFALEGTAGQVRALGVSASLAGCNKDSNPPSCAISVSFTGLPGTSYYTASVTRPDGTVSGFAPVGSGEGGGSVVLPVSYSGAGTYTVSVSAYDAAAAGASGPSATAEASLR